MRSVSVELQLGVRSWVASATAASAAMRKLAADTRQGMAEIAQHARSNREAWSSAGTSMLGFGASLAAGLGLSAKAAIDWEAAFTGVKKTIDGTPEQLAGIEDGLRSMAKTLPATHEEIAAVAEAAGQLGVRTEDILGFTRVMIDLGETTNLTADEAATAIAQFMNVMQTAPDDVDNLGSALVELGNNGASTEREIVQMAQRISGAGAVIGATESDVLGIANALASVGIEVEAGGSAISTTLINMSKEVETGGAKLETFAAVAGVSAEEFARAFEEDPARALDSFIAGLGRINEAGGSVFGTLQQLGITEIRQRDALLRLANAGDLLATSLSDGARAWEENTALAEEAGKRYDTTAAQMEISRNQIKDAAIEFGNTMLPTLGGIAEAVGGVADFFGDLPEPIRATAVGIAALAAAASLGGGGFLLLAPRLQAVGSLMDSLRTTAPTAAKGLSLMGTAAKGLAGALGFVGVAFTIAQAMDGIGESAANAAPSVEDATEALLKLSDGEVTEGLQGLVSTLNGEGGDFGSSMELINTLDALDKALASMVASGAPEQAEESLTHLIDLFEQQGIALDPSMFTQYETALKDMSNQQQLAAESGDQAADAITRAANAAGVSPEQYEAASKAITDMVGAWSEALAGAVDPMAAWETANQRAAESAAEAAGKGKEAWQDFADSVDVSFDQYLAALQEQANAQANWATNLALIADDVTPAVMDALIQLGPEAAPLIQAMVDGTVSQFDALNTLLPLSLAGTQEGIADQLRQWNAVAPQITEQFGVEVSNGIAAGIISGETSVQEALDLLGLTITESVPGEIKVEVGADPSPFYAAYDPVVAAFNILSSVTGGPIISAITTPFFDDAALVNEAMNQINQERPTPKTDLDIAPFQSNWGRAMADVAGLDAENPTPTGDVDIRLLELGIEQGNMMLDDMDENDPNPAASLAYSQLKRDVSSAQAVVNSLRGKEVAAGADVYGTGQVQALLGFVRALFSKTITVTTVFRNVGTIAKPPGRASGGPVYKGNVYEVNEEGQELFMPSVDGTILTAAQTRRVLSSTNLSMAVAGGDPSPINLSAASEALLREAISVLSAAANRPVQLVTADKRAAFEIIDDVTSYGKDMM